MSSYPAAALESAAGTTVDINARNKKSVANVCQLRAPPTSRDQDHHAGPPRACGTYA
jgi:hypothetical protein